MTTLLAIETSTIACSVALSHNGKIFSGHEETPRIHHARLLPMIQTVLAEADIQLSNLDAIAFSKGPGSFVGVRMAVALVQGIAFGAHLKVLPICSLAVWAQAQTDQARNICVAVDAHMQEIYTARFDIKNGVAVVLNAPSLVLPENLQPDANDICVGDAWNTYHLSAPTLAEPQYPNATNLLTLAQADFDKGLAVSADNALPEYLRGKEHWQKPA
jgi:tRNA threonylcarbamoyladenosine biosynthesis protein TsaB